MSSNKLTRLLLYLAIAAVTCVFLYFVFDWLMSSIVHRRKEVMVPAITGKSLTEALDIVSKNNLGLKKDGQEYHPDLPVGTITRQNPLPGISVREGKIIKATISQGSDAVFVPDIAGQPLRKAELTLNQNQLKTGTINQLYSLTYPKDNVISQSPEPNNIVNKNTPVNMMVSLGPPPEGVIIMPDFIGKNFEEAKSWCNRNNLAYNLVKINQPGMVDAITQQFPSPDQVVISSQTLQFTIISPDSDESGKNHNEGVFVHYEVPQGLKEQKVRIVMIDDNGEKEIYSKTQQPGSKIDLYITKKGKGRLRFFINNILVEERYI